MLFFCQGLGKIDEATIEYINSRSTLATPNMAKLLTIEETNRMIAFANENFDCNSDVGQFIDVMIKEFFPDADIAIIKQIFEWSKYPHLKLIKASDIIQIEKDELPKQMKKRLNNTICSQQDYQNYHNRIAPFNTNQICSLDFLVNNQYGYQKGKTYHENFSFNQMRNLNGYASYHCYQGHSYPTPVPLDVAGKYIIHACIFISIWETKKKDHFQSLLLSSNAKMVKQIESLNGQLEYLQSQVYVSNNKISLLQTELHSIKARFTPELVEYDYEAIKSRLDPIREELKMAQRLFARIIRNQYQAPMAVLVGTKSCK